MTDALMKRVWKRNKDTEYGHGMDYQMKMTDALMKRVWKRYKDTEYENDRRSDEESLEEKQGH